MLTFLVNDCETWAMDIGNACLESFTQEKACIIAGSEFGDQEGHVLVMKKAVYGLKSSGKRWSERLFQVLKEMGFFPS